ncbi:MAG: TRCF domain-containing protein, partial [Candidatus Fermentibacteria bacterium]|nr:TRCF domain-containing protein [Candidatus Fermentibacteria bacterium]
LLSTSIIESGIDLPRVNTMFIDNAQNFGLAELYQLRGRVGRRHHRAYCYMITPSGLSKLKPEGRNRLEAIQRYTRLGSGWHIAMRDLELRGAGEFLGAGQSGQVESVGYSMFEELLSREVRMLKGEKGSDSRAQTRIELPGKAFIPEEYMPDTAERVHLYRWVWRSKTEEGVEQWLDYVKDRFGSVPGPVTGVAHRARVNCLAMKANIEDVLGTSSMARLVFLPDGAPRIQKVRGMIGEKWKVLEEKTGRVVISRKFKNDLPEERMSALLTVLRIFAQYSEGR